MEFASHNKKVATPNSYSSEILPEYRATEAPQSLNKSHFPHQNDKSKSRHSNHEPISRARELTPDPDPVTASNAIVRASSPPSPVTVSIPAPLIRYRECLKNHAATMGGHVVDGCGEFMASGEEGSAESMICAACECHRNFHRKEVEGEAHHIPRAYFKNNGLRSLPQPQPPSTTLFPSPRLPLHQHCSYHQGVSTAQVVAPIMMNFGSGGAESSSDDLNIFQTDMHGTSSGPNSSTKKRFRTKFNQEQKDKMMEFAEKIGWKMQKQDDEEVHQFCLQMGIKRKVFKVWMHNNKQAMKKKQT